jgi:hypothetical protein
LTLHTTRGALTWEDLLDWQENQARGDDDLRRVDRAFFQMALLMTLFWITRLVAHAGRHV